MPNHVTTGEVPKPGTWRQRLKLLFTAIVGAELLCVVMSVLELPKAVFAPRKIVMKLGFPAPETGDLHHFCQNGGTTSHSATFNDPNRLTGIFKESIRNLLTLIGRCHENGCNSNFV